MLDPNYPGADWGEIWRTVGHVTPQEWEEIRSELRLSYNRIRDLIKDPPALTDADQIALMIAIVIHSAYHLGEIRQALCTRKDTHNDLN